jgi:hypothetical protein
MKNKMSIVNVYCGEDFQRSKYQLPMVHFLKSAINCELDSFAKRARFQNE